ncbi:hypothetical protein TVAG_388430 [Trichomonas vaginalis G3]|uniref:Uncharacterized protein n=1 Tax=Trichomonas vaginalis (strain ATCC PRA-98 / G3) TaxID=412133 RepID=A2DYH7_TRIV3|nr:hypothetical protein TVAGG3_0321250 [Trichomonas vaginalis G3]EAY14512.1 hypothetical protein TVAG_388430 [Trichomonas vaginalis G3]KAI5529315.1 hypothetical protein TVAGG3_0321250 [Trichomonas vaginalis G3]|eukprot:XP_001326735.1 hypothetical protein [Trichomonas vaginalis G3]
MLKFNHQSNALEFIPAFLNVSYSVSLFFKHSSDAQSWANKIRFIRKVANKTDMIFPPVSCPVILYDPSQPTPKLNLELSFMNNKVTLVTSNNKILQTFNVSTNTSFIFISPFKTISIEDRMNAFSFLQPNWSEKAIVCDSKWCFGLITLTIYLMTSRQYAQNLKKINIPVFIASEFPEHRSNELVCSEVNMITSMEEPNLSKNLSNSKIQFKPVSVPEKASSKLELLMFDTQIKRKIYFSQIFKKKSQKNRKNQGHFYKKTLSFDEELAKLKRYDHFNIKLDNLQLNEKEFPEITKIDYVDQFLHPNIASQDLIDFYTAIGFKSTSNSRKINGYQFSKDVGSLVLQLLDDCSVKNPVFSQICSGIAYVLLKGANEKNIVQQIKEKFPENITKFIPNNNDDVYKRLVIFVARIIISKRITDFINRVMNDSEWRYSYYDHTSPIYSTEFLELLYAAILPLHTMKFVGPLDYNSLLSHEWKHDFLSPSVKVELQIKNIQNLLIQQDKAKIQSTVADIVSETINNFQKCYSHPVPCPLQSMKSVWYIFAISVSLYSHENITKMRECVESCTILLKDPDSMLNSLVMQGFKKGLLGYWCFAAVMAGREDNLFYEDSFLSDDSEMLSYIDGIHILSKILADLSLEYLPE